VTAANAQSDGNLRGQASLFFKNLWRRGRSINPKAKRISGMPVKDTAFFPDTLSVVKTEQDQFEDDNGPVILNQPPLLVSSNPPFLGSEEARQRPVDASAIAEADAIGDDDVEVIISQDTIDAIHDVTDDDATEEMNNNNNNNNNNEEEHKIWIHTYKLCYRYCY